MIDLEIGNHRGMLSMWSTSTFGAMPEIVKPGTEEWGILATEILLWVNEVLTDKDIDILTKNIPIEEDKGSVILSASEAVRQIVREIYFEKVSE